MDRDPRPSPDVVFQEVDGEVVLVHLQTNSIYTLNATGARFWALFAAGHDPPHVRRELCREFDVDPAQLEIEVDALLESLAREGLIVYAEE